MSDFFLGGTLVARLSERPLALRAEPHIDGHDLVATLKFELMRWDGWERDQILDLTAFSASVEVSGEGGTAHLGRVTAAPTDFLRPRRHQSTAEISFSLPCGPARLNAIEGLRNGGDLTFKFDVRALALVSGRPDESACRCDAKMRVDAARWIEVLRDMAFEEHVLVDVALPRNVSPALRESLQHLRSALSHRATGKHDVSVAKARLAVDAIPVVGFGSKDAQAITDLLLEGRRKMTREDRYALVRVALGVLLSQPHHVGTSEEDYDRIDSTFATAIAAAILSVAPKFGRTEE